jgi:hypothetical protein
MALPSCRERHFTESGGGAFLEKFSVRGAACDQANREGVKAGKANSPSKDHNRQFRPPTL